MKKLYRLVVVLFCIILLTPNAEAKVFSSPLSCAIKKADLSKSALIAVSFKDISTGKSEFEMNDKAPMIPASVQKLVTMLPAISELGTDYEFKTQLYKAKNGDLFLKLAADPYLTNKNLKGLIAEINNAKIVEPKKIYIDDSILDANEWGEGWQWDDDLSPSMPKFGAYNIDKNLITINVCPTAIGAPANIFTSTFYPTAFVNNVVTGSQNDIKLERKNYISPDVINVDGFVSADTEVQIPINHPRRYFILRLEDNLRKQKVPYYGEFQRMKTPKEVVLLGEIRHPITEAANDILKSSNNMMAETVFKLAGGKYSKETGSVDSAIEMLNQFYKNMGINTENIKIVDGSGVSKNNLLTADFVTNVLVKISANPQFDFFKSNLAIPGEGTLSNRMLYFQDNLKAKTGTLSNVSSLAGYLTAKSGKTYAFCILTNDPKSQSADKKSFEEYVLREAYERL